MLAESVPSDVTPLIVKRAVRFPASTVAPVTVAPVRPESCSDAIVTDAGRTGVLKFTSSVNGAGRVMIPFAGGTVDVTWRMTGAKRKVPVKPKTGLLSLARLKAPARMVIVWRPGAVTGV